MMNVSQDAKNVISFRDVRDKGLRNGFEEEEIENPIKFFSKAGAILDFQEIFKDTSDTEIRDNIVLRPKFLLESLGRFIYDEKLHDDVVKKIGKSRAKGFLKLRRTYRKYGILGDVLFNTILSEIGISQREISFIRDLSVRMMIFSALYVVPENISLTRKQSAICKEFFLVPSKIGAENQEENVKSFLIMRAIFVEAQLNGTKFFLRDYSKGLWLHSFIMLEIEKD